MKPPHTRRKEAKTISIKANFSLTDTKYYMKKNEKKKKVFNFFYFLQIKLLFLFAFLIFFALDVSEIHAILYMR